MHILFIYITCYTSIFRFKPRPQPAVLASECCNFKESVRGRYCLRTDLGARSRVLAYKVHEERVLRVSSVQATNSPLRSTCNVRARYVHERKTDCLRTSFKKKFKGIVLRAAHVISALSVLGPC